MYTALRITTAAIGIAALSLIGPAHAGSSAVGAGLVGFGIGAILGSAVTPQAVYVAPPPPPVYYVPPHRRFITGRWSMDLHIGTAIIDTGTANPLGVCFSQLLYRAGQLNCARNRRERIAI